MVKNLNRVHEAKKGLQDRLSDAITSFAGSLHFVYAHLLWFGAWILINLGVIAIGTKFDPFPFGLLTLVVSLEAIFLSTFVMISQNRQAAREEIRAELDYETDVKAEEEVAEIRDILRTIAKELKIDIQSGELTKKK